jgi:hypothetical protein
MHYEGMQQRTNANINCLAQGREVREARQLSLLKYAYESEIALASLPEGQLSGLHHF